MRSSNNGYKLQHTLRIRESWNLVSSLFWHLEKNLFTFYCALLDPGEIANLWLKSAVSAATKHLWQNVSLGVTTGSSVVHGQNDSGKAWRKILETRLCDWWQFLGLHEFSFLILAHPHELLASWRSEDPKVHHQQGKSSWISCLCQPYHVFPTRAFAI